VVWWPMAPATCGGSWPRPNRFVAAAGKGGYGGRHDRARTRARGQEIQSSHALLRRSPRWASARPFSGSVVFAVGQGRRAVARVGSPAPLCFSLQIARLEPCCPETVSSSAVVNLRLLRKNCLNFFQLSHAVFSSNQNGSVVARWINVLCWRPWGRKENLPRFFVQCLSRYSLRPEKSVVWGMGTRIKDTGKWRWCPYLVIITAQSISSSTAIQSSSRS
jgi:hypothetical protein